MGYQPAFDGLRAIAVLAVMAFHAGAPIARGGFLGVDLFFVLSGYLITSILVAEHRDTGRIHLAAFYWRRAIRLYPTLLIMLAAFVLMAPVLWPETPRFEHAALAALYLSDYSRAFYGAPEVILHTWSLSVEEHFYLILPLVLPAIIRSKSPARVLMLIWGFATLWRIINLWELGWDATYFRFDTRLSGLVLGCALAFYKGNGVPRIATGAAAVMLISALVFVRHKDWNSLQFAVTFAELASAVLILGCRNIPFLSSTWLAYIGKLSYGIYLWHYPIVVYMRSFRTDWPTKVLVSVALSILLAALTYHLVDTRLRRFRDVQWTRTHSGSSVPMV